MKLLQLRLIHIRPELHLQSLTPIEGKHYLDSWRLQRVLDLQHCVPFTMHFFIVQSQYSKLSWLRLIQIWHELHQQSSTLTWKKYNPNSYLTLTTNVKPSTLSSIHNVFSNCTKSISKPITTPTNLDSAEIAPVKFNSYSNSYLVLTVNI